MVQFDPLSRRGLLRGFLGLAAAPVAAKIAEIAPPQIVKIINMGPSVVDYREQAAAYESAAYSANIDTSFLTTAFSKISDAQMRVWSARVWKDYQDMKRLETMWMPASILNDVNEDEA